MDSGQVNGGEWILDYGLGDEVPAADFIWASTIVDDLAVASTHGELSGAPRTKASREKMRRDRLNERFSGLSSMLDPGKPPKADKMSILGDATRLLSQLRNEAQKLKESNAALQIAIKDLKEEKSELRDEKSKLKAEKEQMEQILKGLNNVTTPFMQQAHAAPKIAHQSPYLACKAVPYPSYPPVAIWHWIPPAALDTSQDHVLRPPVA